MKACKQEDDSMNNESRIVRVETVIEHIQYMLDRIDKRFDTLEQKIDEKFDRMENRFDTVDKKIERVDGKIDSNFKWIVGTIITLFILNGALPAITKMVASLITK